MFILISIQICEIRQAAQSGGVAAERGCGVENGCQGAVAVAGWCGVGSGDGLAGGIGGDGVWGGGALGGVGVEGVEGEYDQRTDDKDIRIFSLNIFSTVFESIKIEIMSFIVKLFKLPFIFESSEIN